MAVAHQSGIVHRDLKPANVLINDEGLLKIVDFGVAAAQREGDTQLTKTGYVIGSPKYMAPEQILGKKVDERADIYSLGVILYEMLTGVPPYRAATTCRSCTSTCRARRGRRSEINPQLPPAATRQRAWSVTRPMPGRTSAKRFQTRWTSCALAAAYANCRSAEPGQRNRTRLGAHRRVPEARHRSRAAPTSTSPSACRRCCACTAT